MDLAEDLGGVVVNADSMQVYRELSVLTARPSPDDEARVPHRLYGVMGAAEACSAWRWLEMAARAMEEERGRVPIVVGGTGLYLKALMEGMAPIPDVSPEVRAKARALMAELGGEAFRERLMARDPEAEALNPGDIQRLVRAWEVVEGTGRPLSEWRAEPHVRLVDGPFAVIRVSPEREDIYARCDARFDAMLARGALEEARALDALGLDDDLPAMKAVGVPQLRRHLHGEWTLEEAAERARQATRNFAKRQTTWLRHQMRADLVLNAPYGSRNRLEIRDFASQFLLTGR